MKNKKNKGFSLPALLIIITLVAAATFVAIYYWGKGGVGVGGAGAAIDSDVESVSQAETVETPPVIEELKYIDVTVSGNDYLYNNTKYTLDELMDELNSYELEAKVKITDDNSSRKAYKGLVEALRANSIPYIEVK